jgi:mannosyltransferase
VWGPGAGEPVRRPSSYSANLQDEIRLVGYDAGRTDVRRGDTLHIRLYWFVQSAPSDNYKVFLHLIKPGNPAQVAQADGEPLLGYSPTTRWEPGELVADDHDFEMPSDLAPGDYQLLVGMYQPSNMRNLAVTNAREVLPGDRIVLTTLRVTNE